MLFGLERLSGVLTSLLLNLEAPFTVLVAMLVFREHLGRLDKRYGVRHAYDLLGAGYRR